MVSSTHAKADAPGIRQQDISIVIDELTPFEVNAIGKSIVGLDNPDLRMFPTRQRDEILYQAVQYMEHLLERGLQNVEETLAQYVAPLLRELSGTQFLGTTLENGLVSKFKKTKPRISVLLSLGKQNEARKVAANSAHSNGVSYGLETVLENHQLAKGRQLTYEEFRGVSEEYLLDQKNFDRITQVWKAYRSRGMNIEIPRNNKIIHAVLDAAENELFSINQSRTSDEFKQRYANFREAFNGIISKLLTRKSDYISLALEYVKNGKPLAASLLSKKLLKGYRPGRDAKLNDDLEALTQAFIERRHLLQGKRIMERIRTPFDYDSGYQSFVSYATKQRALEELINDDIRFVPHQMVHALLEADDASLARFAIESAKLVYSRHRNLMRNPDMYGHSAWSYIYQFAVLANTKLGYKDEARKLETLLKNIAGKYKKLLFPSTQIQPGIPVEDKRQTEMSLGQRLLSEPDYVESAWDSYKREGLFGIRDVTRRWVSTLKEGTPEISYDSHPIEILDAMFRSRCLSLSSNGRDNPHLDNPDVIKARQSIVVYQLLTGELRTGLGSQAHQDFVNGRLDIPNPERVAMGVVADYGYHFGSGSFSASESLRIAERLQQLIPGSKIPEMLYRAAAAEELMQYASEWFNNKVAGNPNSPSSWVTALRNYKKLEHHGLIQFVERNFGTF